MENSIIDEKELTSAIENAQNGPANFIFNFKKPVNYNGNLIKSLSFDFDKLTGKDAHDIEDEVQSRYGKSVIVPALSSEYLRIMAVKACKEQIGSDLFDTISIKDYNSILGRARSFLLQSES